VTRVIDRLKELGYLDDQRFASAYALSRIAARPIGRARVKRDLRNRHVPADIADEALDKAFQETTEDILIQQAIEKRIRLRGLPTTRAESQKLLAHLIRLGFGFDLAIEKVRKLQKDANDD
jgi:regulatory protein